ncbi:MAG: hypothetical protein ACJAWK_001382, partial [Candidatus Azotimanducaceae bacterium]
DFQQLNIGTSAKSLVDLQAGGAKLTVNKNFFHK